MPLSGLLLSGIARPSFPGVEPGRDIRISDVGESRMRRFISTTRQYSEMTLKIWLEYFVFCYI